MQLPKIIKGNSYTDSRGTLIYNNLFDASEIKRMYIIQNSSTKVFRGWQGHKVEKRWFSCLQGEFEIYLIEVDNWRKPTKSLEIIKFNFNSDRMDVLYVPSGYLNSIRSKTPDSKLLCMSNYGLNEIDDEYRFEYDYFDSNYK